MFKKPFSFEGRIRRTEYAFSILILGIGFAFLTGIMALIMGTFGNTESINDNTFLPIAYFLAIPIYWFLWAQNAKRCHDVNQSGWMQIIPFYVFWLLFKEGDMGSNQYGEDPKGTQQNVTVAPQILPSPTNSNVLNNNNITTPNISKNSQNGGYNSGDLYK